MSKEVYYSEYLQLDKILDAQALESDKVDKHAHDEMLFIVIHQAYELWFKQILFEVGSVNEVFAKPNISDNSPDLYTAHHRLKRVITILNVLVHQIDIMETMTPLDFLDFRNMLRPASGFQSIQFKMLEAHLGLKMQNRHMLEYYKSQLKPEDKARIEEVEQQVPLLTHVNDWLERMPFFAEQKLWQEDVTKQPHSFWKSYREAYDSSLLPAEKNNLQRFDELLLSETKTEHASLSPQAKRAALFIMLYRDHPLLQLPFEFINALLEIDEGLSTWRYRHMNMVHRIIGMRMGTGGSSGKGYLQGAIAAHNIFTEFAELTSFLIDRSSLPVLSDAMKARLGFVGKQA